MRKLKLTLLPTLILLALLVFQSSELYAQTSSQKLAPWVAPAEADNLVNPLKINNAVLAKGKVLYSTECVVCHGIYGNAKTGIADTLQQKPKDFTQEDFLTQTDGAIFWKLSEGRGLMQPFKTMMNEEEIWSVIVYVKELAKRED
jgi:mono/diheme cytochrome c family protein